MVRDLNHVVHLNHKIDSDLFDQLHCLIFFRIRENVLINEKH